MLDEDPVPISHTFLEYSKNRSFTCGKIKNFDGVMYSITDLQSVFVHVRLLSYCVQLSHIHCMSLKLTS